MCSHSLVDPGGFPTLKCVQIHHFPWDITPAPWQWQSRWYFFFPDCESKTFREEMLWKIQKKHEEEMRSAFVTCTFELCVLQGPLPGPSHLIAVLLPPPEAHPWGLGFTTVPSCPSNFLLEPDV